MTRQIANNSRRPVRVVCLGGGWVGIGLAHRLKRAIRSGEVELTVVSRDNYHTVHGLIAELLTGKIGPGSVVGPLRRLLGHARLHNAEVVSIDLAARRVVTRSAPDDAPHVPPYDHLVFGIGSMEKNQSGGTEAANRPESACATGRTPMESPRPTGFGLKTFEECLRLRHHLLATLERAALQSDPEIRRRLLTFVIAGGNYAGVEVACDLADYLHWLARTDFPQFRPDEFHVVIVEAGPRLLADLAARHPRLANYAQNHAARLGIETRYGTALTAATEHAVCLGSSEIIATETLIRCTGTALSPLITNLPAAYDARGRIVTDRFLRVTTNQGNDECKIHHSSLITQHSIPCLWAAGDCAAMPHPKGGICPPLALYARYGGRLIGDNLLRTLRGQPLKPYRFDGWGEACSLGHGCAVAVVRGAPAWGRFAWICWRLTILLLIVPTWERRLRLAADWLLTALGGRNIVALHDAPARGHSPETVSPPPRADFASAGR